MVKLNGCKKNNSNLYRFNFLQSLVFLGLLTLAHSSIAQLKWVNVDHQYQPLPPSVHVFYTADSINGKPNHAYYVSANLKDKNLLFETQATNGKRSTPSQFYHSESQPLLVMNCSFFEFKHNTNVSLIIKDGQQVAYTVSSIPRKGKDTFTYLHPVSGAIGISKKRKADVAWVLSDSTTKYPWAIQATIKPVLDSLAQTNIPSILAKASFKPWKMLSATAGGPVLVQEGKLVISNNEEMKFAGKAIADKHPRTAMGYTSNGQLIYLVVEGRFPKKSEGATLPDLANILKDIGCIEALNLDGGGSSAMLINGKPTITPSDKEGERPVPAVMMIKKK
jgi:exopolysaccharide biosynthesis protein